MCFESLKSNIKYIAYVLDPNLSFKGEEASP